MNPLFTIEGGTAIGAIAGFAIGYLVKRHAAGCAALALVPLAMFGYIWFWQSQHPENLRSTSALDFVFGPLWPSLGALAGFYIARLVLTGKNRLQ